ncbi:MAG: hypothetical protein WC389_05495 [Lutibacter sp.]|jgi:hypothetical protein
MARKINDKLIERMTIGDLKLLLNYLKSESKRLRIEVRQNGKCFVYYKKCKILDIGLRSYHIDKKYFEDKKEPTDIKSKVINTPKKYFEETIQVIDSWLLKHKKNEFETQQNIAFYNQDKNDRYLVLDMEYNFSQNNIPSDKRVKKAGFDLLGMERKTGNIVFFEVKKGLKALTGKAGIKTHIIDFEECLFGENKTKFRENLLSDVKNTISDKQTLGLIEAPNLLPSLDEVELIFVYEPDKNESNNYSNIFNKEHQAAKTNKKYKSIFVSNNNYKLI